MALRKSIELQLVKPVKGSQKGRITIFDLVKEQLDELNIAYAALCCPEGEQTPNGAPVRFNGSDMQYFDVVTSTWIDTGGVGGRFGVAGEDAAATQNRSFAMAGFSFAITGLATATGTDLLYYNSGTGVITYGAAPVVTASQGLTATANNITLGGTITGTRSIALSSSGVISLTCSQTPAPLQIIQSGASGQCINIQSSGGNALQISSANGNAISANGQNIAGYFTSNPATSTGAQNVVRLDRTHSAGAATDNIGCALAMYTETSNSTSQLAGLINANMTTVAIATRRSQLELHAVDTGGVQQVIAFFGGGGRINFPVGLGDYVDDATAAAGGVALNQLYRNGSIVMIRVA